MSVAASNLIVVPSGTSPIPHKSEYADYAHMGVIDHVIAGSSTVVTLFKQVADLVPNAGPLSQVLGVTKEPITIVNEMRDNKDNCGYLIERILIFVKQLSEDLARTKVPLQEGTPTAARLYALLLNIKAIKDDAERWRAWGTLKRFTNRGAMKTSLSRHHQNLSDCFQTFSVLASVQLGSLADRTATDVSTSAEYRRANGSDALPPRQVQNGNSSIGSLEDLLQHSAGRTIFAQINQALRSRLEDLEVSSDLTPADSPHRATESLGVCEASTVPPVVLVENLVDKDAQYLTSQIADLTVEIRGRLPDIIYETNQDDDHHVDRSRLHLHQGMGIFPGSSDEVWNCLGSWAVCYQAKCLISDRCKLHQILSDNVTFHQTTAKSPEECRQTRQPRRFRQVNQNIPRT